MKRLCPDMEGIEDKWNLKNGYTNMTERTSFSIEIFKCNK